MSDDRIPASAPNEIVKVEHLGGYRLRFRFKDGALGEHDFTDQVHRFGPMVQPLRDPAYFTLVHLDHGAPTWPNDYDMCPDWVRMTLEDAEELRVNAVAEVSCCIH